MKTQRKLLTDEQKKAIHKQNTPFGINLCDKCPLNMVIYGRNCCMFEVVDVEQAIKDYWNEEIEIEVIK